MIAARGITVMRGPRVILNALDLSVEPGEIVAVLGPNGAGKSTLLAAMASGSGITAGEICIGGRPLTAWGRTALAQRRAVLTQHPTMPFAFTALQVATMGRWPHSMGHPGPDDHRLARAALAQVSASHLEDRPLVNLSGGEKQRVHLARVLCQLWLKTPRLPPGRALLLDEPTASLDPAQALGLMDRLRALKQEGAAILVVMHDLNLAARFADRVALLHQGALMACGPTEAVLTPINLHRCYQIHAALAPHPSGEGKVIIPLGPSAPAHPPSPPNSRSTP